MRAGLRLALLGAWAGSLASFAALVVPGAFGNLPTDLAAGVLRPGFLGLDRLGMLLAAAAIALALPQELQRRGRLGVIRALVPLLGAACHALSYAWVTPEIAELREAAGGSIAMLTPDDPAIGRFEQLHALSRGLYSGAMLAAGGVAVWDVLTLRRENNTSGSAEKPS